MPSACDVGGFNIDLWAELERKGRTPGYDWLEFVWGRGLHAIRVEQWIRFRNGKRRTRLLELNR